MRIAKLAYLFLASLILLAACQSEIEKEVLVEETPWGQETFEVPSFLKKEYKISSFGAKSGPGFNNQLAIQKAIDTCTENGGGRVIIPGGTWETSYLDLKSNVNLVLEEKAILSFSDSIELYAVPTFTRWEGIECMNYHPLIYANGAENIAITGLGKIDGNGKKWWPMARGGQRSTLSLLYDMVQANIPPEERNCLELEPQSFLRPSLFQAVNCKNVLVEDFEVGSGPMWTLHFVYSENVIARNLRVITDGTNNDGIIPDASKKMLIDNCYFSTGDDCIVIKSGLNEDGWRVGKASERIVIKNCNTKHGHGGVVIGSEMSGGVRNIYAHDCNFSHTQRGLRVKSMKGRGGIVENLWFENIIMDSITDEAIKINMHYGASSIAPRTSKEPIFRNFNFKNISSSFSRYCVRIDGIEGNNVENLNLENIMMKGKYGIVMNHAQNCTFDSIAVESNINEPLQITNSDSISFNKVWFKASSEAMIALNDSCTQIELKGTNFADFEKKARLTNTKEEELIIN